VSARLFLLDPQSLAAQVSAATYGRGLAVLRNQQVLRCDLSGANSQDWTIAGLVNGSHRETYEVLVDLETVVRRKDHAVPWRLQLPGGKGLQAQRRADAQSGVQIGRHSRGVSLGPRIVPSGTRRLATRHHQKQLGRANPGGH